MQHLRHFLVLTGILFVAALGPGCTLKDPCDPDQDYRLGQCQPQSQDTDDSSTTTSQGGGGGQGGASDTSSDEVPNFGAKCTDHPECKGGTVCGAEGGVPECLGLCGKGDPFESNCPSGMTCLNTGQASVCF